MVTSLNLMRVRALNWDPTGPHQAPTSPSLVFDSKLKFLDGAPPPGTGLKTDSRIKFVDSNFNGLWNLDESVVYDANNNSQYDNGDTLLAGVTPASSLLRTDPKIRFVDVNFNNVYDPGEAVVYDANSNGVYDSSEAVIYARSSPLQSPEIVDTHLKFVDTNLNNVWDAGESVVYNSHNNGLYSATIDPHIKFVDLNSNNVWNSNEPVAYDANNNNLFDAGDIVISGAPSGVLKSDAHIKFVDTNLDAGWEQGEAVVYDANNNGVFDTGEPVIAQAAPAPQTPLSSDNRIKFWDQNNSTVWNPGEPIIYDDFQKGYYNATIDPKVRFLDNNHNGHWDPGEPVLYDKNNDGNYYSGDLVIAGTPPNIIDCPCPLTNDLHFRFVDTNRYGIWAQGEAVTYETDTNNIYDSGETVVTTTIPVPVGTLLSEPIIAGVAQPPVGTLLTVDPKIRFLDVNANSAPDPGEPVIYDSNGNGLYDSGEPLIVGTSPPVGLLLSEPVIAGSVPAIGTSLKTDAKIKLVDANSNGRWDPGEIVTYDSNGNGKYDLGEPLVSSATPTDGVWNPGEPVVYDTNNNGVYDTGEAVVAGAMPVVNSPLKIDPLIRFIDSNSNNRWDPGEIVVYDTNNNALYDTSDTTVSGNPPITRLAFAPSIAADPLGRVWVAWNENLPAQNPSVFFRMWNGTNWTSKQQVTSDSNVDNFDFITPLANQTMMILWSSNRTGQSQIFYRLYASGATNPYPTTNAIQLTSSTMFDVSPRAVQDRSGRIWVVWARQDAAKTMSSIYYKYFNGSSWSSDFPLPGGSNPSFFQNSPSITQTKDGKIWIVFSSDDTTYSNLYFTTTDGTLSSLPSTGIAPASWTAKVIMFTSLDEDDRPSIIQSRDGILWVFYQKDILTGTTYIYYGTSSDNGATWVGPVAFTAGTDDSPSAAMMPDHRIWVAWNRLTTTQQLMYTSSDQILNIHDLGVRGLAATPTLVESGDKINITVTALNYGDFQENNILTLRLNSTILTTVSLTLNSMQSRVILYTYQTVQPAWGKYSITTSLSSVVGENSINQGDNSMSIAPERVSPPGDVDRNGVDNILDVALVAYSFGSRPGGRTWNLAADINHDGVVDILDVALVAFYFGQHV